MYRLRNQIGPSENSQSIIFCKRTLWYAQRCPRAIRRESPFCNEHLVTKKDPFRLLKRVGLYILLALLFLIHSTSCISYQVPSDHSNLKVGPSSASDLKLYCDDGARCPLVAWSLGAAFHPTSCCRHGGVGRSQCGQRRGQNIGFEHGLMAGHMARCHHAGHSGFGP